MSGRNHRATVRPRPRTRAFGVEGLESRVLLSTATVVPALRVAPPVLIRSEAALSAPRPIAWASPVKVSAAEDPNYMVGIKDISMTEKVHIAAAQSEVKALAKRDLKADSIDLDPVWTTSQENLHITVYELKNPSPRTLAKEAKDLVKAFKKRSLTLNFQNTQLEAFDKDGKGWLVYDLFTSHGGTKVESPDSKAIRALSRAAKKAVAGTSGSAKWAHITIMTFNPDMLKAVKKFVSEIEHSKDPHIKSLYTLVPNTVTPARAAVYSINNTKLVYEWYEDLPLK